MATATTTARLQAQLQQQIDLRDYWAGLATEYPAGHQLRTYWLDEAGAMSRRCLTLAALIESLIASSH